MPAEVLGLLAVGWVFLATLALVLLSVEGGYRLGLRQRARAPEEKDTTVGAMVGAMLGLLAFLLAFTFGLAANRFEAKRTIVVDEANAVGTTWLRAGMLPQPQRSEVRKLLREYVDVRLAGVQQNSVEQAIRRSEELHTQLWAHATAVGTRHPESIQVGLFVQSLNETIDLHAKRIQIGIRSPIPSIVWIILYGVAILSLGVMGYQGGLSGSRRSLAVITVAAAFSGVIWLIADLDRSQQGLLRVSQQALIDVRNSMSEP